MSATGDAAIPTTPRVRPDRPAVIPAILIGFFAFLIIRGPATLAPTSILWLGQGDQAMHTLGWWFFSAAPWGWPPGANPLYGLEFANGIGLSDSLPLFAFPFKLLSPLLPDTFQYWGYWTLLCFILQAVFAVLVAHELGLRRSLALVAALFCVVQPAFLIRVEIHMALAGHWTILAALWLYLKREAPGRWSWPLLLGAVAAIHGYLLVMVFAIWLAALAQRRWLDRLPLRPLLVEVAAGSATMLLMLWATGIFMVGSVEAWGFGQFRMNLLGPFNPVDLSLFLPRVDITPSEWEGIHYLGLGMMLLLPVALAGARLETLRALFGPRFLPLVVVVLGLAVFALSHRVALGSVELFELPLPAPVERFFNIFRSSGRMFWPLGYLLIFFALVLLARRWRPGMALAIALAAGIVQVVDLYRAWSPLYVWHGRIGAVWNTGLTSPAWAALAPHYQRLRHLPVEDQPAGWRQLSYLAYRLGLGTDAVHIGRIDPAAHAAAAEAGRRALAEGSFDGGAIYDLDETSARAAAAHLEPGDLLARIDGRIVFARGGAAVLAAAGIAPEPFVPAD